MVIDEVEKVVKRDAEKKDPHLEVNRLVLLAFFGASEGVALKDGMVAVTDAAKVKIHADFKEKLTYDPKTVKDEADLVSKAADLLVDPEFTAKLMKHLSCGCEREMLEKLHFRLQEPVTATYPTKDQEKRYPAIKAGYAYSKTTCRGNWWLPSFPS